MARPLSETPGLQGHVLSQTVRRQPPFLLRTATPCARPAAGRINQDEVERAASPGGSLTALHDPDDRGACPPGAGRELLQAFCVDVEGDDLAPVAHQRREGERFPA